MLEIFFLFFDFLFSFLLVFLGITLIFFKTSILKGNKFSWFILFLLIPLPTKPYETIISFLQYGSAEGVDIIFRVLDKTIGFTYVRNKLYFYFPNLSIHIAKECSGIRSTTALLLTALLAARIYLSTLGGRAVLVIIGVILSILKNSIRIATLSLLAVRVDPRWITQSDLHEKGGFIFFGITLLMLIILIFIIKKVELRLVKKKEILTNSNNNSIKDKSSSNVEEKELTDDKI
ncbi:MAG: exosortase/archaeosortase family protein [Chitinispirillaceae bacterium]|nr:exosortase/archaeosortase family protein [Chitinispirillaceae bacterium]